MDCKEKKEYKPKQRTDGRKRVAMTRLDFRDSKQKIWPLDDDIVTLFCVAGWSVTRVLADIIRSRGGHIRALGLVRLSRHSLSPKYIKILEI